MNYAMEIFNKADDEDRMGEANKYVAEKAMCAHCLDGCVYSCNAGGLPRRSTQLERFWKS